jgi:hypothetical protein
MTDMLVYYLNQIALQINTDEKIQDLLLELKNLKNEKQASETPTVKQNWRDMELSLLV